MKLRLIFREAVKGTKDPAPHHSFAPAAQALLQGQTNAKNMQRPDTDQNSGASHCCANDPRFFLFLIVFAAVRMF